MNEGLSISSPNVPSSPLPDPAQRGKREGRRFFLTLLVSSGLVILLLAAFFFQGKAITLFSIKKFVVNKAFVTLLPKAYSLEEAERVREVVYHFYESAGPEGMDDRGVLRVSAKMQAILSDEKITDEEVKSLLSLIEQVSHTPQASHAPQGLP